MLTKPSIVLLVAISGLATMAAEGSLFHEPVRMLLVLIGIVFSAGAANALNQFIDRDIDSVMERTKKKRPLPLEQVSAPQALAFGFITGVGSVLFLYWIANLTTALLALGTILFYTVVYTLWLKRRHHYNIVIGGAAGAAAPIIASAAAFGQPSLFSWFFFWVIFFWTPPHFWALALAVKEEYAKVKVPMLPNVCGDKRTRTEIIIYTISLLPLTILPFYLKMHGVILLVAAIALWIWYFWHTILRLREETIKSYRKLFFISIVYLFFYFIAATLDGAVQYFYGV